MTVLSMVSNSFWLVRLRHDVYDFERLESVIQFFSSSGLDLGTLNRGALL